MKVQTILSRILPVILFSLFIYAMSALSDPPAPDFGLKLGDKINHFGAFAIMAVLAIRAASALRPGRPLVPVLLIAIAYCALFGASDEYHQSFVANRTSDVGDLAADVVGALAAALVVYLTKGWRFTQWLIARPHIEQQA